eukprot:CAMPEP_0119387418 /NCGR_PEP_ID=MMETSP1334-20130426/100569_1 /TAXON_ID=127549 /ORGANISM="Calcidiscus leptoporus, Strain RCC1130" /LENGTH=44 /DNA_ID= /DNA_START= /DNA_END= /DNA_ORIENTATION=
MCTIRQKRTTGPLTMPLSASTRAPPLADAAQKRKRRAAAMAAAA